MSEHGFHVHGPHDHALEHEAQAEPHGFAGRLAVATAIIATIGALFAYMGGLTQANAGLYKNESAIKKDAEKFEKESDDWSKRSDEQIHQHHRWAQATTALQISIALAAIALLTKSKRLQVGVYALSAIGVVVGVLAWLHI